MRRATLLYLGLMTGLPACGDSDDNGGPGPAPLTYPEDTSESGIAAFLSADRYTEAPWGAETATPRDASSIVSPHGRVRVWLNDILVASQRAGNGDLGGNKHDTGSMAVKEMFDGADARMGRAVMLKIEGDADDWVYYCEGTTTICGSSTVPYRAEARAAECSACHGGLVFTNAP